MIYLDFFSGSHGHFLEYVINTWLFKGPKVPNIFTTLGASHNIRNHYAYMKERLACAAHYSEFSIKSPCPSKLVRISITNDWANWIYQINILSRAGDVPIEKKLLLTPSQVRNVPKDLRNEWYAKFNLANHGYPRPGNWQWQDLPSYNFPMESLFDHATFYSELYQLSKYLDTTFVPDQELGTLLTDFLSKNQGWQYYSKCQYLIHQVFAGTNVDFSSDQILQALINSSLTKSVGMFDGMLFDQDDYPTNTRQLWDMIQIHLESYDSKF